MTAAAPLFCTVAIELSRSRWRIGVLPPRSTKVSVRAIAGGDTARLMEHLDKTTGLLARRFGTPVGLKVCFEAGYDGFWLARFLRDRGVECSCSMPPASWCPAVAGAARRIGSTWRR
jgi:transposase